MLKCVEVVFLFFYFFSLNFILFDRNNSRLGNGVLYASVNPEYFSAADGKFLCSIHVGSPRSGSFWVCCSYRGRDLHYLEGPLASDSSLLPFLFFFFFKVSSSSLNSSKILQTLGMPQGKAGFSDGCGHHSKQFI